MTTENTTQLATSAVNQPSTWTDSEKRVIKAQFFPEGTTPDEMKYCMAVAEGLGLNPILKQIWFVPRRANVNGQWREKVEPMAGRDSFLTLAHRSGQFAGIKSWVEIKDGPALVNGAWELKSDLYGIAEVKRKDTPEIFRVEVKYAEYVQTKKDGTPTSFWFGKPETMIKKVAESQVLRKAFNIAGLYDEAEVERPMREVSVSVTPTPKMTAQKEQEAYDMAEKALLDCDTIEQLENAKQNFTKEDMGYLWDKLDQVYLGCVDDLSRARVEAADDKINTDLDGAEDFPV